jgi:hypothetical protein
MDNDYECLYPDLVCLRCGRWIAEKDFDVTHRCCVDCAQEEDDRKTWEDSLETEMHKLADALEPTTHCCECTPGLHYDSCHTIHIQYPGCKCNPKEYVLRKNTEAEQ